MNAEILIQNGNKIFQPVIQGGIQWTTERKNAPSRLRFSVVRGDAIDFTEGNPVRFRVNGVNAFYGFVFTQKRNKEQIIEVTAYDQLRYLKNKDTYVFRNETASDIIRRLAADFRLQVGTIENTGFIIPSRIEDNTSLFDMIYNALDMTFTAKQANEIFTLHRTERILTHGEFYNYLTRYKKGKTDK